MPVAVDVEASTAPHAGRRRGGAASGIGQRPMRPACAAARTPPAAERAEVAATCGAGARADARVDQSISRPHGQPGNALVRRGRRRRRTATHRPGHAAPAGRARRHTSRTRSNRRAAAGAARRSPCSRRGTSTRRSASSPPAGGHTAGSGWSRGLCGPPRSSPRRQGQPDEVAAEGDGEEQQGADPSPPHLRRKSLECLAFLRGAEAIPQNPPQSGGGCLGRRPAQRELVIFF
jgi:hypothetical protein